VHVQSISAVAAVPTIARAFLEHKTMVAYNYRYGQFDYAACDR